MLSQKLLRRLPALRLVFEGCILLFVRVMHKVLPGLTCVLLLSAPMMVCLAQGERPSPAEQQCCQEMAGQCGHTDVPSSHSCCKTVVRSHDVLPARTSSSSHQDLAIAFTLPSEAINAASQPAALTLQLPGLHGPPESPSDRLPVLRI